MKRRVVPILLLLLVPHVALAADPPKAGGDAAAAQSLFYEARTLMEKGKYIDACPKLEESLRLDPGIGTQFNLADCNEHVGKLATAWAGFLDVAAQSKATNQPEREKLARKRARALEPRLPKLVVEVPAATPGLEIKRDGVVIGSAAWGTAIPVDAGTHKIAASAPGKQPWEVSIQATEGKTARVAVPRELPNGGAAVAAVPVVPTGPAPAATGAVTSASLAQNEPAQYFPPPVVESRGAAQRTVGWVATGIGVVGLSLGAGFGLSSLSKRNEAREHCIGNACDADGVGLRDDAIRSGNIATIATIAGGVAAVGGLVLVLTAPKGEKREQVGSVRAMPTAAMGGGGFMLQGAFQ